MNFQRKKIGEILVEIGVLTPAEVSLILERLQLSGGRFGQVGMAEGLFDETTLAQALARQFDLEYQDLDEFVPDLDLMSLLPSGLPLRYQFLPLEKDDSGLTVAVADPTDVAITPVTDDDAHEHLGLYEATDAARAAVSKEVNLKETIRRARQKSSPLDDIPVKMA